MGITPKGEIRMEKLIFSEEGATLKVKLLCEIDHHGARELREAIDGAFFKASPDVMEIDFSEVRFMDSSGIGLIIGRAELAQRLGSEIRIVSLSRTLQRIVRLSGIEKIKNITIM